MLSVGEKPTVIERLVESKQLAQPVFGFFLSNDAPGELVLGGVSPEHYDGEFHFIDLDFAAFWSVTLDAVELGSMGWESLGVNGSAGWGRELGSPASVSGHQRSPAQVLSFCR